MVKKIIITGGSGLVGSNFVKGLSNKKKYNECRLFSLYNFHPTNFKSCENIKVDITNRDEVISLLKIKPDLIIHCAAVTGISFCEKNRELANKINISATKNIVELAKKTNAKLIYLSTDAVFDGLKGNYSETDEPSPVNVYGKTKLDGEKVCINSYENTVIARISFFGKNLVNKKSSFVGNIINNLKKGKIYYGFYDAKTSLIYIKNLLDLIIKIYEEDAKGIYHIGGLESPSKYEFAKLVSEVFGFEINLVKKASIESLYAKDHIKRSKDCSFNISKILNLLNIKSILTLKEMVIDFKNQEINQ